MPGRRLGLGRLCHFISRHLGTTCSGTGMMSSKCTIDMRQQVRLGSCCLALWFRQHGPCTETQVGGGAHSPYQSRPFDEATTRANRPRGLAGSHTALTSYHGSSCERSQPTSCASLPLPLKFPRPPSALSPPPISLTSLQPLLASRRHSS